MSLSEYLQRMDEESIEFEKVAAEEEAAGRIMARGFMDELNKLAADPFGELDTYMKQKGIRTPAALRTAKKPAMPAAQAPKVPSRKQILGGAKLKMQTVAPGSAQARAITQKAQRMKAAPPPMGLGEAGRRAARETYLRNKRIMEQQQRERY